MEDKDGNPLSFVLGDINHPKKVVGQVSLSKEQFEVLAKGVMAHSQDDKWLVFCRGSEFYFHRSWGGQRIYQASFSNMDEEGNPTDNYSCNSFFVEGNGEIYKAPETDDEIKEEFQHLLIVLTTHHP